MKFDLDVDVYEPGSANIRYEKVYPWEIPITVIDPIYKGTTEIEVEIIGAIDFDMKKHIKDMLNFYSLNKWTAGLANVCLERMFLTITIIDRFITIDDVEVIGNDGLHIRGIVIEKFPNAKVEISKKGCIEILGSHLNEQYKQKHWHLWSKRPWTFDGWIKHALAHELAHLVCNPSSINKHKDEILAQLFATHYDVKNEPLIYVPS
ncbi:MAG: hypothetical protein KAW45_02205, partial [Thermoplasmatales archaeon]|nr:hypothetical protein [Thermoplasmatales archaeon]